MIVTHLVRIEVRNSRRASQLDVAEVVLQLLLVGAVGLPVLDETLAHKGP
jgi:hypothetical protein